jgi:hypothetical protein
MEELIIKGIGISLFCVGLRIITSKGMIGYPLRKPFENLTGWKQYIMKPFILCVTCYASVYTVLIEYTFYSISEYVILLVFMVAALNSIIFALYSRLK